MADDGGYSVWGDANDDIAAVQPSFEKVGRSSSPKRTSHLFDDLDEANADWSVQASPPAEIDSGTAKRHSYLDDGQSASGSTSAALPIAATTEEVGDEVVVGEMADKLDSTGFDDFDDGQFASAEDKMDDDDFGDFGEFEEEQNTSFQMVVPTPTEAGPSQEWRPLSVSSLSDPTSMERSIRDILAPAFSDGRMYPFHDGAASQLSQDKIRQVEGEAQVMVREESRNMWHSLTSQPNVRPVDWMRSSTRRQHLISLGIPINLDEVRVGDATGAKSLPLMSLQLDKKPGEANGRAVPPRHGTPDGRDAKAPELDVERAKELTSLTEDQLTLLTLPALRDISREMESLTRQASALLTHHLSQREAHNADAEMYNGLIRDLVTGAANRFGATGVKRSSTLRKASTNSGRNSPAPSSQVR